MYERILAPLLDAESDVAILEHAAALARLSGATLILAFVVHAHSRDATAYLRECGETYLQAQADKLRGEGLTVKTVTTEDEPAEGIRTLAEKEQVDLIVMGSHGHRQLRHFILGSVTEAVIRSVSTPVLLVKVAGEAATKAG